MYKIEEGMISIGVGTRTVVVVGIVGENAILLDETRNVIEPMKVFRRFGRREIDAKNKTVIIAVGLVKKFIGDDEVATGEGMIGEGSIPGPEGSDMWMRTGGRLFGKTLVIALAFENGTIAEDDAGANNGGIHIIIVFRTIGPFKRSKGSESQDLVGIVMVIIALFDVGRQRVVVENVRRRVDTQGIGGNGKSVRNNIGGDCGCSGEHGNGSGSKGCSVNEVKIETIKIISKVERITVGNNDKSVILICGGFVDSRGNFVLGAKATPVASGCLPREVEFSGKNRDTIRSCRTGTNVSKELDDFGANGQKKV
jgi:hypothetical protein